MNYYKEHKMNGIKERLVVGAFYIAIMRGRRFILPHTNRYFLLSCMFQNNLYQTETFRNYSVINLLIRREPLVLPRSIKNYIYRQNCNFACCPI